MVDSRTDTPLKMTEAKRKAHMWAVFFHTLETIDVITVSERAHKLAPCRTGATTMGPFAKSPNLIHFPLRT